MFDPNKASKEKAIKALKKRATTDVMLWANKAVPESCREG